MLGRGRKNATFNVNPIFGTLPESHPAALAYRDIPRPSSPTRFALVPLFVWVFLSLALAAWLFFHREAAGAAGFLGFLSGFLAWCGLMMGTILGSLALFRRSLSQFDVERMGSRQEDETYVGVAFADGIWNLRDDVAWDRGYLSVSPDGVRFRGYASNFALPAHAIRSVRLETGRLAPHQRIPRLFIEWASPDGEVNTLSLDTRPIWYGQGATEAIVDLRDKIFSALQMAAAHPLTPIWPPAVRLERLDLRVSQMKITLLDLAALPIGLIVGLALMIGIYTLIAFLPVGPNLKRTLLGDYRHIFSVLPQAVAVLFLIGRVVYKYKTLPAPNQAAIDPLPRARAQANAPSENLTSRS